VHHRTTLSACIFATKACIDNRKKNLLNSNIFSTSPQYGELWPTNGWDRFGSLGQPSKFLQVSRLAFVTAAMSLTGSQPNFEYVWPSPVLVRYIYIHFRWLLLVMEFCLVQNSLYVQVLHSPILAALLHSTPAAGVSQLCGMVQGMELWNFRRRCHLYSDGQPWRWASAHSL